MSEKILYFTRQWLLKCRNGNGVQLMLDRIHCMSYSTNSRSSTKLFTFRSQILFNKHKTYSSQLKRKWIQMTNSTIDSIDETTFSLMSYNILAQHHVDSQPSLYYDHEPESLQWSHRFNALKMEIDAISPDILCLQEVQQNHLPDIAEHFSDLGYDTSMFKKRTGLQVDGCAIFYKKDLFDLIECHFVDYFQPDIKVYLKRFFNLKKRKQNLVN